MFFTSFDLLTVSVNVKCCHHLLGSSLWVCRGQINLARHTAQTTTAAAAAAAAIPPAAAEKAE
jgi:hypothetical protein